MRLVFILFVSESAFVCVVVVCVCVFCTVFSIQILNVLRSSPSI